MSNDTTEWVLGHQFLLTRSKMSIGGAVIYEGLGLSTKDPKTGEHLGWWFDNQGSVDVSKGKRDGDTVVATSEGPMGKNRITTTLPKEGEASFHYERMWPGTDQYATFLKCTGKKK